jgi:hypothetical protein
MLVVDRAAARASHNTGIRGYGCRLGASLGRDDVDSFDSNLKQPNTVIASEAKQSMGPQSKRGSLRFARNDGKIWVRDLAA